jgi:mono/diheme cytochrome c family protein
MNATRTFAMLLGAAVGLQAFAGEDKVILKEGAGVDKVRANCVSCHSLDYIPLNSPFLDRKGWDAVVAKMTKAFGAPIRQEDAAPIAEYLARHYGKKEGRPGAAGVAPR